MDHWRDPDRSATAGSNTPSNRPHRTYDELRTATADRAQSAREIKQQPHDSSTNTTRPVDTLADSYTTNAI
eukprot:536681-Pyramimonas_sp.AAC.1